MSLARRLELSGFNSGFGPAPARIKDSMSRISELRKRDWTTCDPAAVAELSCALNPSGRQVLRLIQAMALRESLQLGGVWCAARVGAGKTLIAGLLATLYEDQRPLVVVPGGHGDKTELEFAGYRKLGWELSHKIQVVSYSDIARDVDEKLLRTYSPGRLICDEVDKLRRVGKSGSGTAKRVSQWMAANPTTGFDAMSGTMFKEGLKDYGHILNWTLKGNAPVPELPGRISAWHTALKEGKASKSVWKELTGCEAGPDFRKAFRERLWYSPGVLISVDCFDGVPLNLEKVQIDAERALDRLYETGETPDGLDVVDDGREDSESIDGTWAVERQMALGFYYKPDPDPPKPWAKARRDWFRFVRRMIESGDFNTELQVRRWAEKAQDSIWLSWKAIQPTFQPRFIPVWLNDNAIEFARAWGRDGGTLWTDHRAFAERLSAETGWRWFAGGGRDQSGMMIEQCRDKTVIVSRQANGTGRNLQHWNRALVTALPGNGRDMEQLLGRQHREGQMNPVHIDILMGCRAHHADLAKVIDLSQQELEETGRKNKILTAGWG